MKKVRRRRKPKDQRKISFKEKVTETLELPKEVMLDLPKLIMFGNNSLMIENFKGITAFEPDEIKLTTGIGTLKIGGDRLVIKEVTSEDIIVDGVIKSLEFFKA